MANIRWQDSFFWQSLMFLLSFLTCFLFWVFSPVRGLGAPRSLLRPALRLLLIVASPRKLPQHLKRQLPATLLPAVSPSQRSERSVAVGHDRDPSQAGGSDSSSVAATAPRLSSLRCASSRRPGGVCVCVPSLVGCARLAALRACASRCALRVRHDECETTDVTRQRR